MKSMNPSIRTIAILAVAIVVGISASATGQDTAPAPAPPAAKPDPALLDPSLATRVAPETYRVKVETTVGDFVIEVHRDWAPKGADRFYNLVKIGFYDGTAFYRVMSGFMAQVGMHGDPKINAIWSSSPIEDDPVVKDNSRGMVTFAMQGRPNSRTTQIFINYGSNSYLREAGAFAPFGKVVEGFDVVKNLYNGYGDCAPRGKGPSQERIYRQGNQYLKAEFPKLDYINHVTIIEE